MTYYHYCNASAFYNIIRSKEVWLSSMSASNDSMEGKWLSNIIGLAASRWGVPEFAENLITLIRDIEENLDCLGFCLSEAADTLSQWRGYADDGAGFSIGFSDRFMDEYKDPNDPLIHAQKVIYGIEDQIKMLQPFAAVVVQAIEDGAFALPRAGTLLAPISDEERASQREQYLAAHNRLIRTFLADINLFFKLKNRAFEEEHEWRLIRMAIKPFSDLDFRVSGTKIVPYLADSFGNVDKPISHVMIGPKNPTPKDVVTGFLARHGFNDVHVEISAASYR
ncbi:DUF2971 domain-containing protein [Rhizobium leguminosarum]|uniref:DUF2971 domain-containing protein n=1 Tax=Rhizobium leguminosarum TaxID=384 RepID=UPI001C93A36F|nr:DUF2971 domain-containing protein [Rhizobium leguminosarum]MBY5657209.1 DUF2971 domain-containing protein [Rhizobium leguminosarum]